MSFPTKSPMRNSFDVIIIGGSYSGLAAAMALGRALRSVLVIDSGFPCNRQTPHSHNFLTQDGAPPAEIASRGRKQVENYETIALVQGIATRALPHETGFEIQTAAGEKFIGRKLIFATGIKDILPDIPGLSACWGISVLHCPYCHGYEVRNKSTGLLANGEAGFEFAALLSNWTPDLTLYTNGTSTLSGDQVEKLAKHSIHVAEAVISSIDHSNGHLQRIVFGDGSSTLLSALYTRPPFEQHCTLPAELGCEITDAGYLKVDMTQRTSVPGVYACGDNVSAIRTVANAVGMGTTTGMMVNKDLILEDFDAGVIFQAQANQTKRPNLF